MHEFIALLLNPGHWLFELFLMFVFDVLIGLLLWPLVRKYLLHHKDHHTETRRLEEQLTRTLEGCIDLALAVQDIRKQVFAQEFRLDAQDARSDAHNSRINDVAAAGLLMVDSLDVLRDMITVERTLQHNLNNAVVRKVDGLLARERAAHTVAVQINPDAYAKRADVNRTDDNKKEGIRSAEPAGTPTDSGEGRTCGAREGNSTRVRRRRSARSR